MKTADTQIARLVLPDGSSVALQKTCSIGSSLGNDIVLNLEKVSRRHALVHSQENGRFCFVDLGSSNGSYVNGRRVVQPVILKSGDIVDIGSSRLQFRDPRENDLASQHDDQHTLHEIRAAELWLKLDRPGAVDVVNGLQYIRVDRVNYDDVEPWPTAADGHGSSLCRILERGYGNDSSNWMAAPPKPGSSTPQSTEDSDGDGLLDVYELANGLNPRDSKDAALDSDGDGMSNLDESHAGTSPRDSSEVLRLTLEPGIPATVLRFVAVAGRSYTIQYKDSLADSAWLDLGHVTSVEVTGSREIRDAPMSGVHAQRFYRLITP